MKGGIIKLGKEDHWFAVGEILLGPSKLLTSTGRHKAKVTAKENASKGPFKKKRRNDYTGEHRTRDNTKWGVPVT